MKLNTTVWNSFYNSFAEKALLFLYQSYTCPGSSINRDAELQKLMKSQFDNSKSNNTAI